MSKALLRFRFYKFLCRSLQPSLAGFVVYFSGQAHTCGCMSTALLWE